jgi:ligand-binding SRPBCC domain-containing protein
MAFIRLTTEINAPVEKCFDASRSIDLHTRSMRHTAERAVAGKTAGLLGLNEWVTWQARHFGLKMGMTIKITELQHHAYFVDKQVKGPFKILRHYHQFTARGDYTLMIDEFVFRSPFGWVGKLVDRLFMKKYMERLLLKRNEVIKSFVENLTAENYESTRG